MALKIGIIGCGKVTSAHMNGLKELAEKKLLDGALVTALCDTVEPLVLGFRKRGEGPEPKRGVGPENDPMNQPHVYVSDYQPDALPAVYTDYRKLLAEADIDAAFVLTPVFTHHSIALDCLRAGKHVLVEKPFAVSVKAGRHIVAEAARRSLICGVAESLRYLPIVRAAKWAIEQGLIGSPQFFHFFETGIFWAPDRIVGETSWRHKKLMAGGGASVDSMVHYFDVLRYLMGEVDAVQALTPVVEKIRTTREESGELRETVQCEVDDTISCSLLFANGAMGNLFFTWAGRGPASNFPGYFSGTKGFIRGDTISIEGQQPRPLLEVFEDEASVEQKKRFFPHGIRDCFSLEILDFLSAVGTAGATETSGEEGVRDLSVSFAALESSLSGKRVRTADILSGKSSSYEKDINAHYRI
jgi:1,5-anhydro-D-fructose reductase (1,5-anhydro-D-mannitol-forming)